MASFQEVESLPREKQGLRIDGVWWKNLLLRLILIKFVKAKYVSSDLDNHYDTDFVSTRRKSQTKESRFYEPFDGRASTRAALLAPMLLRYLILPSLPLLRSLLSLQIARHFPLVLARQALALSMNRSSPPLLEVLK